jgi:hypothetical protein
MMLDYIRKQLTGPDSFIITVTTLDEMFERAGVIAVDQIGIVIEARETAICLPWNAILEIEIED